MILVSWLSSIRSCWSLMLRSCLIVSFSWSSDWFVGRKANLITYRSPASIEAPIVIIEAISSQPSPQNPCGGSLITYFPFVVDDVELSVAILAMSVLTLSLSLTIVWACVLTWSWSLLTLSLSVATVSLSAILAMVDKSALLDNLVSNWLAV